MAYSGYFQPCASPSPMPWVLTGGPTDGIGLWGPASVWHGLYLRRKIRRPWCAAGHPTVVRADSRGSVIKERGWRGIFCARSRFIAVSQVLQERMCERQKPRMSFQLSELNQRPGQRVAKKFRETTLQASIYFLNPGPSQFSSFHSWLNRISTSRVFCLSIIYSACSCSWMKRQLLNPASGNEAALYTYTAIHKG